MSKHTQDAVNAAKAAGHTAGPWSLPHFAQPDVNCECGYVLCDHMMGAIATVHCSGEGDDWKSHGDNPKFDEAVANARLIAAAPDLLAALKQLLFAHPVFRSKPFGGPGSVARLEQQDAIAAEDAAREVIARATGTQP